MGSKLPKPNQWSKQDKMVGGLKTDPKKSIYIAIMDEERQAAEYQCLMKKMWIDKLAVDTSVEGIEFYSYSAFKNTNCNITSVTVPKDIYNTVDQTAWQLRKTLENLLERTKSGWIYVVGDSAYIDSSKFVKFMAGYQRDFDPFEVSMVRGNCIERAYFFQELAISSGILMSRKAVHDFLNKSKLWDVAEKTGIHAQSVLGEIIDWSNGYIKSFSVFEMAGNEFFEKSDYDILMERNYDSLKVCEIPKYISQNEPGTNGACLTNMIQLNTVVSWAGAPKGEKLWFFNNVKNMITDIPDSIGFYWHWNKPKLCILPSK